MTGNQITKNHGRWLIPTQDKQHMKAKDQQAIDLDSNGMSNDFHFAIQDPGQKNFSAWYRDADGSENLFALNEAKYKVNIHFRSNNGVEADFVYIVTNDNGNLSIKEATKQTPY